MKNGRSKVAAYLWSGRVNFPSRNIWSMTRWPHLESDKSCANTDRSQWPVRHNPLPSRMLHGVFCNMIVTIA